MISKEKIEKLICEKIELEEQLGDQAGGSGHLSFVEYDLEWIGKPQKTEEGYVVEYRYTLVISTEFTIYPDNPPYTYPKSGTIIIKTE
ncbi:MAG: hypothetical protein AMS27_09495 [Bacteroides sp. SM23_62_1]|nr:MAG: hypothetical protein AMS27_09495 [Bacteroides sp. SM23_62_1]